VPATVVESLRAQLIELGVIPEAQPVL
jgi:hypothetical protein